MLEFHCNRCSRPLRVTSVPLSVDQTLLNGSRGSSIAIPMKSYVTNCKHMFCQNCIGKCQPQCAKCQKPCKMIEINEKMPPQMRVVFESIKQRIVQCHREITTARSFQQEQNRLHRQQLTETKRRYYQAGTAEMVNLKEAQKQLQNSRDLNRKLKCFGRMMANQQKQRLVIRPNIQQQPVQSTGFSRSHRVRNDGRPYSHMESGFCENKFSHQHHGYRHDTPGVSSINCNGNEQMRTERPRNPHHFTHSTPFS